MLARIAGFGERAFSSLVAHPGVYFLAREDVRVGFVLRMGTITADSILYVGLYLHIQVPQLDAPLILYSQLIASTQPNH